MSHLTFPSPDFSLYWAFKKYTTTIEQRTEKNTLTGSYFSVSKQTPFFLGSEEIRWLFLKKPLVRLQNSQQPSKEVKKEQWHGRREQSESARIKLVAGETFFSQEGDYKGLNRELLYGLILFLVPSSFCLCHQENIKVT